MLSITIHIRHAKICANAILVCAFFAISSQAKTQDVAEWPRFRGANRDGISAEKNLLKKWPQEGPKLIWTLQGLGNGLSSVSIKSGLIYLAGTVDNQSYVCAADLSGKIKWKTPNGAGWEAPGRQRQWAKDTEGAKSTPTIDEGLVFHMNERGRLTAMDANDGTEKWFVDLPKQFAAIVPLWGYAQSVLIDGDRLICYPGGRKGRMVALDKKTGQMIWANTEISDEPSYASPTLVVDRGIRQVITMTRTSVIGLDADTGKFLWRYEHINNCKENDEMPLYFDGKVLVSSGYGRGSDLLNLTYNKSGVSVERVWTAPKADNMCGGPILLGGHVYGAGYDCKAWYCLDFSTGTQSCSDRRISRAALTYADGLLYALMDDGTMTLSEPSPDAYKEISRFKVPAGGPGLFMAHPVVCGGRLYIRHSANLYAYDISAR